MRPLSSLQKTIIVLFTFLAAPVYAESIVQWRSIRAHSGCAQCELAIVLDPARTGNDVSGPTVETRGPTVAAPGVQKVHVDFDGPVTLSNPGNITVTYRVTTPGSPATMGSPIVTVPSLVTMADPDTLQLEFSPGQIPNMTCINILIGPGTLAETLVGDADCNIRSLFGDVNGTGRPTLGDTGAIKAQIGQPIASAIKYDVNLSAALINIGDQAAAKSQIVFPPRMALCP